MRSDVLPSLLLVSFLLSACGPAVAPAAPVSTVAPAAMATVAPSPTPASTATPRPTATPTRVPTMTPSPTATATVPPPAATATPRPALTATPRPAATATPRPPAPAPTQAAAPPPAKPSAPASREVVRGNATVPAIALTFDAGAGASSTADILAALAARNLRATFFLTGKWAEQNPDLVRQIHAAGHEISNHSYNHPDFTKLSHGEMVEEINSTERIISRLTGTSTRPWFRFPFGARSAATQGVVTDLGYTSIYWTLDSLDSIGPPKTPQQLYDRVTGNAGNGYIVLMHIGSAPTAAALPRIIENLQQRGFRLVTISELLS